MRVIANIERCNKMDGCKFIHDMVQDQPLLLVLVGNNVEVRDLMNNTLGIIGMPVSAWLPYRLRSGEMWLAAFRQQCMMFFEIFGKGQGQPPLCTIWRDHGSEKEEDETMEEELEEDSRRALERLLQD